MDTTDMIRVMIVDDHDLLRTGLALFLEAYTDLKLVGEATTGVEAVERYAELKPDVILMDLLMPEMDGASAIRVIHQQSPDICILALTSYQDEDLVQAAIQAGAIGYLLKNVSTDVLAGAIRDAYLGKPTLSPEAAQALISVANRPPKARYDLTEREREVLHLMTQGMTNIEIAGQLSVSRFTVKKHVSNILAKLNTASRTEAVAFAIQHKLVEHDLRY